MRACVRACVCVYVCMCVVSFSTKFMPFSNGVEVYLLVQKQIREENIELNFIKNNIQFN